MHPGFQCRVDHTSEKHFKVFAYKRLRTFLIRRRCQVVNCQVAEGVRMPGFCLVRSEGVCPVLPPPPPPARRSPAISFAVVYLSVSSDSPARSSRHFFSYRKSGRYFPDWKNSVWGATGRQVFLSFPGWGSGDLDRHRKEWLPPFFL